MKTLREKLREQIAARIIKAGLEPIVSPPGDNDKDEHLILAQPVGSFDIHFAILLCWSSSVEVEVSVFGPKVFKAGAKSFKPKKCFRVILRSQASADHIFAALEQAIAGVTLLDRVASASTDVTSPDGME